MKSNEIIKQIGSFSICFLVILLVLFSTIFFILEIYRYLFWPQITGLESELKETVGIVSIGNETLLSLLAIVLAFAAALSWSFYKIIERDIKEKSEKAWQKERNISKAEMFISAGVFHMHLYKTLYEEKTKTNDTDDKARKEIESSLSKIKIALENLKAIEEERCLRQLLIAKNNLAYYLARFWNYYKEEKDDCCFKDYLQKNDEMRKKYNADKRIAEQCMQYLKEGRASQLYPDLSGNFEDTFEWIEKVFGLE